MTETVMPWSGIEAVITSTTGNRVTVKSRPRVRIPPTPPKFSSPQPGWAEFFCGWRDSKFRPRRGESLPLRQNRRPSLEGRRFTYSLFTLHSSLSRFICSKAPSVRMGPFPNYFCIASTQAVSTFPAIGAATALPAPAFSTNTTNASGYSSSRIKPANVAWAGLPACSAVPDLAQT